MLLSADQAASLAQIVVVLVLAVAFARDRRGKLATEVVRVRGVRRVRIPAKGATEGRFLHYWNLAIVLVAAAAVMMLTLRILTGDPAADDEYFAFASWLSLVAAIATSIAVGGLCVQLATAAWEHLRLPVAREEPVDSA